MTRLSPLAQRHWDAVMWCTNHTQLAAVGTRIRQDRAQLAPDEIQRLRDMFRIRRDQFAAGSMSAVGKHLRGHARAR